MPCENSKGKDMIGHIDEHRRGAVADAYDSGRAIGDAMAWSLEPQQVAEAHRCPDFHAPLMGGLNRQDGDDTRRAFLFGFQVSLAHALIGLNRDLEQAQLELARLRGEVQ